MIGTAVRETSDELNKNQSTEGDEYEPEQIVNVPVPEVLEETVEGVKPCDQEIPQESIVAQITDVPATAVEPLQKSWRNR